MKDTNYVEYFRISTNSEKQTLSFGFQRESVDRFIETYGGTIVGSFTEEITGTTLNRKLFREAVDLAASTGSVLIVHKLSRLSRTGLSTVHYMEEKGVEYIEAVSPMDSPFVKGIKLLQAQEENRERKDTIKRGLGQIKRNIRKDGFHISKAGRRIEKLGCPENLTNAARENSIITRRKKALKNKNNVRAKAVVELLLNQDMSIRKMAKYLNKKKFKTSTGKEFKPMTVSNLIKLYQITKILN
jgi:DNA invertase Pin-like site-specific DNA recombinase